MSVVTFTAKAALPAGFMYGQSYSLSFARKDYDGQIDLIGDESISISGARETVVYHRRQTWDVTTGFLSGSQAAAFGCFLASVADGSSFQYDRDATTVGTAIRPLDCELLDDSVKWKRISRSGFFSFVFRFREIEQSSNLLFGEDYYFDFDLALLTAGINLSTNPDVLPGFTYTRTGDRYALRDDGIFHSFGPDVLISQWDAVNQRELGPWIGSPVNNVLLYSSDISNAAWVVSGVTKNAATGSVIEGGIARKITCTTSSGHIRQSLGTFDTNPATAYAIVEKGDTDVAVVILWNSTSSAAVTQASLTFSTGVVTLTDGAGTVRGYKLLNTGPNGGPVWLVAVTGTGTNGNSRTVNVYPAGVVTTTGFGFVHHVQLQTTAGTASYLSPPIVTTTVAVTTGADVLKCSVLPYWFRTSEYTLAADLYSVESASQPGTWALAVSDGTATNYAALLHSTLSANARADSAGVTAFSQAATVTLPGRYKYAARYKSNDFAVSVNGASVLTDAVGAMPITPNKINIGSAYNDTTQSGRYLARIVIAPSAWSNADLQSWST